MRPAGAGRGASQAFCWLLQISSPLTHTLPHGVHVSICMSPWKILRVKEGELAYPTSPLRKNGQHKNWVRWHLFPYPSLFTKYYKSFPSLRRWEFSLQEVNVQIPPSDRKCVWGIKPKLRRAHPAQGPAGRLPSHAATPGPLCSRTNLRIPASPPFLKPFLHTPTSS